jgi:DNA-binding CsgD family transcriptional regulator
MRIFENCSTSERRSYNQIRERIVERFNQALVALYDLAEHAAHNEFHAGALNLLQPWIKFDGAVLWMGNIDTGTVTNLLPADSLMHQPNQTISWINTKIGAIESVIKAAAIGLKHPIQWNYTISIDQYDGAAAVNPLSEQKLRHVILFGENQAAHQSGRWVMLHREGVLPFDATEARYLHMAWLHLKRSMDLNRARVLDRHDPKRVQRASALIDDQGLIMAADYHFHLLLSREWPNHQTTRLPSEVVRNFIEGCGPFRGQRIEILMVQQPGYITCTASPIDLSPDLTPREYMVARRYANGLSHKEIARELHISPHTVRNQIAHLYGKLGVHDKATLTQHLVSKTGHKKGIFNAGM